MPANELTQATTAGAEDERLLHKGMLYAQLYFCKLPQLQRFRNRTRLFRDHFNPHRQAWYA